MLNVLFVMLAFALILLNAFFVVAEFAIVKLRPTRLQIIRKKCGLKGKILHKIHNNLDAYLSTCQLGITLASIGLGWVGEPAFSNSLRPAFAALNIYNQEMIELLSFIASFSAVSFLHIVIGELLPKSLAIRQTERFALWIAIPLYIFYWLMYPCIWMLNFSTTLLLKLLHAEIVHESEYSYSNEEIKLILKSKHIHTELNDYYKEMLLQVFEFNNLLAIDIMRPLESMVSMPAISTLKEKISIIKQYQYSRYPVYQAKPSNIIGVLHAKDILLNFKEEMNPDEFNKLLRPVVKVQKKAKASEILEQFRQGKPHFALIYNQNKLIGFITLDNLLYALLGKKLKDEFHFSDEDCKKMPNGHFLIKGSAPLYIIEKLTGVDLSKYAVDTVEELLQKLDHRHPNNQQWVQERFTLRISKIVKGHILEVILIPHI